MHAIFVYGTLLQGEKNDHYLKGAICIYQHAWVNGQLNDTNFGYPVMKQNNNEKVYGEVYMVTDEQLKKIDELEGYQKNRDTNLYERITTNAYNDQGEMTQVFTYITGRALANSTDEVPLGNWKVYTYLQGKPMYYFAYGSCMDDERFKLAHVDEYFISIMGKGVLEAHGFRFTKSTTDGGKADIIEANDEQVEGIVYLISEKAIDYLYEREGVYTKGYRPAVIRLQLQGELVEALTFIRVEKDEETKPTKRYANEIIRGGTDVLSKPYMEKLRERVDRLMK